MSARRFLRQSRSDVFWSLAAFAALQVGLAAALVCWLPALRDPDYGVRAERLLRRAAGPAHPLTVVMLGSSRTAYGLKGMRVEEELARDGGRPVVVFNLGTFGGGTVTELLSLRRLLARGLRPDLLLVEVVPPLLAGQAGAPGEVRHINPTRLGLDETSLLGRYGLAPEKLRSAWWRAQPVPWYAYRFEIVSQVAPAWLPFYLRKDWSRGTDASGWAPHHFVNPTPERRRQAIERARQEYAAYLTGFRLGGAGCTALVDLLEVCRTEGLRAAVVLMPEGTDFRGWYTADAWGQIQSFLGALSARFCVPVLDARTWVPDEGFSDSHHLLPAGAEVFSRRLGREAIPPLLHRN